MPIQPTFPFPRYRNLNPLPQDGLMLRDETYIRHALAHDDGPQLGPALRLARLLQHLQRHAVPPIPLLQRKLAVELEVQRVV